MTTLSYFNQGTKLSKRQINIVDFFNVKDLLFQRGFEDITEGTIEETLLNATSNPIFKLDDNNVHNRTNFVDFIERFSDKNFRLRIRNMVLGKNDNTAFEDHFIFSSSTENEKRYSNTVELLIAYLCIKELKALSASYGVKIKNAPDGSDFDCLANFQNSLFHFEIKSGNIKNIDEAPLKNFLNRHNFLSPNASILFLDYQSGNKSEIDNLVLKFKNLPVGPLRKIDKIIKITDGQRKFYALDGDILVVDLHNNGDILSNLRSAVQYFHRYNSFSSTMTYHLINPADMGYIATELEQTK